MRKLESKEECEKLASEVVESERCKRIVKDFMLGKTGHVVLAQQLAELWDGAIQGLLLGIPKTTIILDEKSRLERDNLNRQILNLYRPFLCRYPNADWQGILQLRYEWPETRYLSIPQLADFVEYLTERVREVSA